MTCSLVGKLCSLARNRAPYEVCGVVRAVPYADGFEIRGVTLAKNAARDRVSGFRLRAHDAYKLTGRWLAGNGNVSGVFHTHTLTSAAPSARDLATMRGWQGVHLIAAADGSCRTFISHCRLVEARIVTSSRMVLAP